MRAARSLGGIITFRSSSAATRSSSPNACGIFPPRAEGRVRATRSNARHERHFEDSFISARLAIARALLLVDGNLRGTLKAEGLLRRDPRMKERKKSGQPGARKRFQFSKR